MNDEDRGRERERDRARRAAKGATPRAQSLSQRKPWEVDGVSRAQWYRRRRHETPDETNTPVTAILSSYERDGRNCLTPAEPPGRRDGRICDTAERKRPPTEERKGPPARGHLLRVLHKEVVSRLPVTRRGLPVTRRVIARPWSTPFVVEITDRAARRVLARGRYV